MIKQEFVTSNQNNNNIQDLAMKEESVKVDGLTCCEVDLEMPELRLSPSPPSSTFLELSTAKETVLSPVPPTEKRLFNKEYEDRTIIVRNLPVRTTEDKLIKYFIRFGLIRAIRWTTHNDKPLTNLSQAKDDPHVNAIIEFVKRSGALASLMCIKMFHGKLINVSLFRNLSEKELQQLKPDLHPLLPFLPEQETRTIFLRDLPNETRQNELLNVFLPFGLIESIRWFHNKTEIKDTSKLRSGLIDVFIVFCQDHSAEAARRSLSLTINKTKVTISKKTYRQIASEYFPGCTIQQLKGHLVSRRLAAIKEDILPYTSKQEERNIIRRNVPGPAAIHQQTVDYRFQGPRPGRHNPTFMPYPSSNQRNPEIRYYRPRFYNGDHFSPGPRFGGGHPGFPRPNYTMPIGDYNHCLNNYNQQVMPMDRYPNPRYPHVSGEQYRRYYPDSNYHQNQFTLNVYLGPNHH